MMTKKLNYQSGFSLVEVMVTALVLGIGLIGMAALQSKAIQYNHGAYVRSQANILAYDIGERMRLNADKARVGSYDTGFKGASPSGSDIVSQDVAAWKKQLKDLLPRGEGAVQCSVAACSISIRWSESADKEADAQPGKDQANMFTYVTQI